MSQQDCLFCKIIDGDIPSNVVFENEDVLAFRDINPQAPTHVLVIPRRHIATINDIEPDDAAIVGSLYTAAKEIAAAEDKEAEAKRLEAEYRDQFANPYVAAERGYLDDVIEPRTTRPRLIAALSWLETKRDQNPPKKHGNIPL